MQMHELKDMWLKNLSTLSFTWILVVLSIRTNYSTMLKKQQLNSCEKIVFPIIRFSQDFRKWGVKVSCILTIAPRDWYSLSVAEQRSYSEFLNSLASWTGWHLADVIWFCLEASQWGRQGRHWAHCVILFLLLNSHGILNTSKETERNFLIFRLFTELLFDLCTNRNKAHEPSVVSYKHILICI